MHTSSIDPQELLRQLDVDAQSGPKRVMGGASATLVWKVETRDGVHHALRLFAAGETALAEREQIAMTAARDAGLPVPRIEKTGVFEGRPMVLMEWVAGTPMLQGLRPWNVFEHLGALGSMQAALHCLAPPDALRNESPHYWISRAGEEHRALTDALLARGVRTDTLVHQDFHPLNVLVGQTGIWGIIDWASAAAGDPRADVALTISILRVAPIPPGPLIMAQRAATRLLEIAWRRGYERTGKAFGNDELAPFLAWAGAVMVHEMSPRVATHSEWVSENDIIRLRSWRDYWKQQARLV